MKIQNRSVLDNLIVGRIDPHIYAFKTNTIPNYLKVGDTYRPVSVRIKEWLKHFPDMQHDKEWIWTAKTQDGKYFRDFAVHYYLETIKGFHRLLPDDFGNLPYYSREFFENAKPSDVDNALHDIEQYSHHADGSRQYQFYSEDRLPENYHYKRNETYPPRGNQEDTIKRFISARNAGHKNLLMYAVMRFGKSFTSMCCALEMRASIVLILSAKADVREEWKRTVESHVRFADFCFLDSTIIAEKTNVIGDKLKENKKVALFLTLQDLAGDGIKDKHQELFKHKIDLLIVDETHFGARAEEYGKILRNSKELKDYQTIIKEQKLSGEKYFDDLEKSIADIKGLDIDTTLHLSGTPYRILMGSEFKPDDIVAFYQYTDIIDDMEKYDLKHINDDDYKEWDNPYYGFPQMIRFAFNPNATARKLMERLKADGKSSQLNELFRPFSVTKGKNHHQFVHEKEVLDFLSVIDGSKEDDDLFGFLDYDKLKDGKMCRHMVFVLPFCASCDALEKLLNDHKSDFLNLNTYEVVNISGIDNNFHNTGAVKAKIESIEKEGRKSITLTVNKMLTGSTVKEWDTMLFLKDVSSPQEYDQAIFRLQSQYVTTYKNDNGETIKYNMKPQTLLVDFDPNRMFYMQEQKSKIYNVNTNERGNDELEQRLRREIEISPIIVFNRGKIGQVTPTDIMDSVRSYCVNKTVMEEATTIPTDTKILNDPLLWDMIKDFAPINNKAGLSVRPFEGEGEDYNEPEGDSTPTTTPNSGTPQSTPQDQDKEDDEKREKHLAAFFARILFFSLLTRDKVASLQQVKEAIKRSPDNQRIAQNIGLRFKKLCYLQRVLNPFVLSDLDYKISNINDLLRDKTYTPTERIERALKKFGRLSVSEIVTPSDKADEIVGLIPKERISANSRFLDIASKQGEFACALYKRFGSSIKNNIYALPTSPLSYEFTRKVFEILDIPIDNVIRDFYTYDLIDNNKDKYIEILKAMRFNAVVGNPPYQQGDKGNATSDAAAPIYQKFVNAAKNIYLDYISFVIPSKWMVGGRAELSTFLRDMKQDNNIVSIKDYIDDRSIFPDTHNDGGICYVLWDKQKEQPGLDYTYIDTKGGIIKNNTLSNEFSNYVIRDSRVIPILKKILYDANAERFSSIVSKTRPFGLRKDIFNSPEKYPGARLSIEKFSNAIKIYGVKGKKGGARRIAGFVDKSILTDKYEAIKKYKIFFTTTYSAGAVVPPLPILSGKNEACTETFLLIGPFNSRVEQENCHKYIRTTLFQFLLFLGHGTMQVNKEVFRFIPMQNFSQTSDIEWTKPLDEINKQLFTKYNLDENDIKTIETIMHS